MNQTTQPVTSAVPARHEPPPGVSKPGDGPTIARRFTSDAGGRARFGRNGGLEPGEPAETSARQVASRIARCIRTAGENYGGYFKSEEDANAFEAELCYLLVHRHGAFDAPVLRHCGAFREYGVGRSSRRAGPDPDDADVAEAPRTLERPRCGSCFIQSVPEDPFALYDLLKSEARLFEDGTGTGSNFSTVGERSDGSGHGGAGLMAVLDVFDRSARTRRIDATPRPAKLVCLDLDHPAVTEFIEWKVREGRKARALALAGLDWDLEQSGVLGGQNSRTAVRVADAFMRALQPGDDGQTLGRAGAAVGEAHAARELWNQLAEAAWASAEPAVHFDSTINSWHTCPNTARINASSSGSEFMFMDDAACSLCSLDLCKFLDAQDAFDVDGFRHAAEIFFLAQEILVDLSAYPTRRIARNAHDYRPIGLGYGNLAKLLRLQGVAYDSEEGRAIAAALTAILCGRAYRISALLAAGKGPFTGFARNREPMLRVMRRHQEAAYAINRDACPDALWRAAVSDWNDAVNLGERFGYRNAQATLLPSMSATAGSPESTHGVDPVGSLVELEKLAGGEFAKALDESVPRALQRLGHDAAAVQEIVRYVVGTNTLLGAPFVNRTSLLAKGFTAEELDKVEVALPGVVELRLAFAPRVIGKDACERFGVTREHLARSDFDLLEHLGFSAEQLGRASEHIVGRMTLEGAPGLAQEHLAVFDCANRGGRLGRRSVSPLARLRMMAAVQPFLSGAIGTSVQLSAEATPHDLEELLELSWRLGLKAVSFERHVDGSPSGLPAARSVPRAQDATHRGRPSARPSLSAPGIRVPLPSRSTGFAQRARVGRHEVVVRADEFDDGRPGEVFIDVPREDSAFRSVVNCLGTAVSVGLQHGVPLDAYVEELTSSRFDPHGWAVGPCSVEYATSIVDYAFRVLDAEYRTVRSGAGREDPRPAPGAADVDAASRDRSRPPAAVATAPYAVPSAAERMAIEAQLLELLGEAPLCDRCGHPTVRRGGGYECRDCGGSMGC